MLTQPLEKFGEENILVNTSGAVDTTRPDLGPLQVSNPPELILGGKFIQRFRDPITGELDNPEFDPIAEILKPPTCINGHWETMVKWLRRDGQELFEGPLGLASHSITPYLDGSWEKNWWLEKIP